MVWNAPHRPKTPLHGLGGGRGMDAAPSPAVGSGNALKPLTAHATVQRAN